MLYLKRTKHLLLLDIRHYILRCSTNSLQWSQGTFKCSQCHTASFKVWLLPHGMLLRWQSRIFQQKWRWFQWRRKLRASIRLWRSLSEASGEDCGSNNIRGRSHAQPCATCGELHGWFPKLSPLQQLKHGQKERRHHLSLIRQLTRGISGACLHVWVQRRAGRDGKRWKAWFHIEAPGVKQPGLRITIALKEFCDSKVR